MSTPAAPVATAPSPANVRDFLETAKVVRSARQALGEEKFKQLMEVTARVGSDEMTELAGLFESDA